MNNGIILRKCSVCGKNIINGHYFGKVKIPVGKGEHKKVGISKLGNIKCDVVRWTGKGKHVEYWECNKCFDTNI